MRFFLNIYILHTSASHTIFKRKKLYPKLNILNKHWNWIFDSFAPDKSLHIYNLTFLFKSRLTLFEHCTQSFLCRMNQDLPCLNCKWIEVNSPVAFLSCIFNFPSTCLKPSVQFLWWYQTQFHLDRSLLTISV